MRLSMRQLHIHLSSYKEKSSKTNLTDGYRCSHLITDSRIETGKYKMSYLKYVYDQSIIHNTVTKLKQHKEKHLVENYCINQMKKTQNKKIK